MPTLPSKLLFLLHFSPHWSLATRGGACKRIAQTTDEALIAPALAVAHGLS
jgi:hypothetical protein